MVEIQARRLLQALLLASVCNACASPPAPSYRVLVRVESDPGVALAGAKIRRDGQSLGESDARGELRLQLRGPAGSQLALEVLCPSGSRSAQQTVLVALRPWTDTTRRPEYAVQCRPERRSLVVAVRAPNAAHVPLRYLGREIARTDAQGAAHGLLELAPDEVAKLTLDTSAPEHRWLRPRNPELKVSVPDHDEVVLFDQPFVVDAPKKPVPHVLPPELPRRF
jgi:hypothetical protein